MTTTTPATTETTTTSTSTTTTAPFVPPPGQTTTGTETTSTTTRHGPFVPPSTQPPSPPGTLPYTGANPLVVVLFGIGLLGIGLALTVGVGRPSLRAAPAGLWPGDSPAPPDRRRRTPMFDKPRGEIDYRVVVPGRGEFRSVDEAERPALDRRWARAGCARLGAIGRRRDPGGPPS